VTDDDDRVWATPLGTQRQFPEWYRPGSAPWFERGQSEKKVHPSALQSDRQTILLPPRGDAAVYRGLWSEVQHETGHLLSRLVRSLQEETYLRFAGRHRSGTLAMSKLWKQRLADYRLFRRRQAGGRRQVAVCVLVDESASMKGHEKWRTAAKTVVLLGEALDRLDVPFEIIGFTTADYEARRALQLGLTPAFAYRAMRCSRLEHRLYKAFEEPYRSVRTRLSDIQPRHNNWDEEHLLFAHRRIRRRPEPSRVIIIVSDGQPNGEADHLIATVAQVEREGGRIIGVGIGEDFAARIYGSAITAADFGGLAEALLGALGRELGVRGSAFGSRGMPVARPSGAAA
jgi:cobaltochelatase CobT